MWSFIIMTSSLPSKQTYLLDKFKYYWHLASERISKTPERSLDCAYQSILKIKALEDEQFKILLSHLYYARMLKSI